MALPHLHGDSSRHPHGWIWDELLERTSLPRRRVLPAAVLASFLLISIELLTEGNIRLTLGFIFIVVIAMTWTGRSVDALAAAFVLIAADSAIHKIADGNTAMSVWWGFASSMLLLTLGIVITASFRNVMLRLRSQARRDPLTGLYNIRAFQEAAEIERARAVRSGMPTTIAFIDLDSFKQVNDVHGHLTGDKVLQSFAESIVDSIRAYDIVGRVGGDEFTLLLPETDEFAAAGVVQRIRHRMGARTDGPRVSATIGLVTFSFPPATVQDMIRAADELMYDAKRHHGGNITLGRVARGDGRDHGEGPVIEIDFSVHSHPEAEADLHPRP